MKKFFTTLLISFASIYQSAAQQATIDSLRVALTTLKEDTLKIDALTNIATKYFYIQPDSTLFFAEQAELLAQKIKDKPRELFAINRQGGAYWIKGNYVKALEKMKFGYEEALKINHNALAARNLGNIGLVYFGVGSYSLAIDFYQKSIPIFLEENNQERIAITYNNIADAYLHLEQIDSAQTYIEKALPISEQKHLPSHPLLLRNLGVVYFKRGDLANAELFLRKALSFNELQTDKINLAATYRYLSKIALAKKNVSLAKTYIQKAVAFAESVRIKEQMYEAYKIYADIFEAENNDNQALRYRNLFIIYQDSAKSQTAHNHLQIFEYEKKQGEVAKLTAKAAQHQAQLDRQRFIILVALIVILFVTFLLWLTFKSRQKIQQFNKDLNKANKEINLQKTAILSQNEELAQQNEFIKQQSEKLADLNFLKDRLFSIISHDLRSPLGSLKTMISLFEDGDLSEEEFREMSPMLEKDLDYTLNLLNNLLQWAKSQMEGVKTSPEVFAINELAEAQVGLLERLAENKGIKLENQLLTQMQVFADKNMIDLVMRNLVANAIKFCNEGDKISIIGERVGDFVHIKVEDTGIGIAAENLPKLFNKETFTTRGTTGEKGTGLGLILCKEFVERNHGDIWVESEVGKGSTFIFTIPFHANKKWDSNTSKHSGNLSQAA